MNATDDQATGALATLRSLLHSDPDNLALIADTAEAAVAARAPEEARALLERYAVRASLPPRERNIAGLAALQAGDHAAAEEHFAALSALGIDDPAVRFNLAWARAHLQNFTGALEVLDDATARTLPQAAALRVQLLHQTGDIEAALASSKIFLSVHPDHRDLLAATSVLAIDAEDEALADECARRAGDHPDALTTLGTLALGGEHASQALELFDRALATSGNAPRALVGRGLAKLLTGNTSDAFEDIDRGAGMFGEHLGSWIAAGWAHFVNGDLAASRARFETALAVDPNFAETHGSLAVLAIVQGDRATAERESDIALRLDTECYSAALAKTLLAAKTGDATSARRIFERAAATPVDGSGRTIGKALATIGLRFN